MCFSGQNALFLIFLFALHFVEILIPYVLFGQFIPELDNENLSKLLKNASLFRRGSISNQLSNVAVLLKILKILKPLMT